MGVIQIEVKEENEDKYSIMINLGQYLSSAQIEKIEEVIQKTYNKGHDDGYRDASKAAMPIIGILCKREPDNVIVISDQELHDIDGTVNKYQDNGNTYFNYQEE